MGTDRPDDAGRADEALHQHAAYVHVPFCRRVCPYCDFAVQAGGDVDGYLDGLIAEIEMAPPFDRPLASLYVGGGTPTSLTADALQRLVDAIRVRLGLRSDAEVSIEANPEDLDERMADDLRTAGFNRISVGVQSFDPVVLEYLGRAHDPDEGERAIATARAVFPSVNVDLIFGSPMEDAASWSRSVERAIATGIDHLSAYALTVERGTPLSRDVAAGAPAPDPDVQADRYEVAMKVATTSDLVHYETSNFARNGHGCVYNLVTWAQGEYEAFGNGAHRHRDGERSWNIRRVDRYLEAIESGKRPIQGRERLESWAREKERVLLGLRRRAGVDAGAVGAALVDSPQGRRLVDAGVLALREGRLVVERPLLGDEVARTLLALEPVEC